MDFCDKSTLSARDAMEILRLQKHDFLNYMQIINGYLQMGNIEKALGYVKKATQEIEEAGAIMRIAHPALGINLLLRVHNAYKSGVKICLSTGTDLKELDPDQDFEKLIDSIFLAIEELVLEGCIQEHVGIGFREDAGEYSIKISLVPCRDDGVSELRLRIKELLGNSSEFPFNLSHKEDKERELWICFPKTSRSG